ncbi:phage tail protein [Flavihumibacter petaseus]|uniref:Tail spike domain-containing protein n=1 Tax=Flavihumibacter petaseus NBRC 106054 TaxID=1220578 RepID=A0A0E9N2A4_9BACT|nr:phage tail protein [Flavihumibacter petaseus]GAO43801.1 hypothetical protein FPE01S_02_09070 [Flavihumibacter petaseus NBRC 106054]
MKTIDIYRGTDLLATIKPSDSSTQNKAIMGDNALNLDFEDSRHISFQINDWCEVFGERYVVNAKPTVTKSSTRYYDYKVPMVAEGTLISRVQFLFLGDDNSLKEPDFSLMGNADTFMDLLMQNLHRVDSSWVRGQVQPTAYKNMTFSAENCYNALSRIAEEFGTEFWLEGKTVHLVKRVTDTGHTFKYGRGNGLYDLTGQPIDQSSVITRLYAFGSDKNLPSDYRNFSRRLRMTDGELYVEQNTAQYGVIEFTQIFDDIFPHRTGKVTGVNAIDPFLFTDSTMDFDINAQLLPGISAKVTFNTGQLSGYTLEIKSFNNTTKEVRVLLNKDERALDIPNTNIRPAIGDEYVFVDIIMPDSYITAAEAALKEAAVSMLDQVSVPQEKYTVTFDPTVLRRKNIIPAIGQLLWITDSQFGLDRKIRITSSTRKVVDEWDISVELADTVNAGKIDLLVNNGSNNARDIVSLEDYLKNNSTLNNNIIGDVNIRQGTVRLEEFPTTATMTGFSEVVVENATGKLFKKV